MLTSYAHFPPAPTNEAFNALPAGTLDDLLDPANIDQLQDILKYHVVEGTVLSSSLTNGPVTTLNGDDVTISGVGTGVIKVNDATVTTADIVASNGVIHVIDAVLIPPQTRPPLATRPPLGSVTRPPIVLPTTNAPTTTTPTIKPTEAIVTPPPTVKATTLAPITSSPTMNPITQAPVTPAPVPLPVTPPPTPPPQVVTTPTTPFPTEVAPPLEDTSSPTNLVSRPFESPPPVSTGGGGGDTTGGSKDDGWMTAGMPDSSEDYEWVSSDHKDCVEDHTPIFGYSKSSKKSSHWGWGSSHQMSIHSTTEGSKDDGWNRNGHTSASWMSYDQVMMHFKSKSSKKCKSHKSSKSKSSKSKVWGKSSKASGKSNKSSKGGGWNYNNALERVDFIGNGGSSSRLQRGPTTVVMFTCLVMGIVVALGSMC